MATTERVQRKIGITQPMNRVEAFKRYQQNIGLFSRDIVGTPLYPYQMGWANYVLGMVREGRNETVVVEMPRQSGKNETSAQMEVAMLARAGRKGGEIVKTAPTWKPQIVNSLQRFADRADSTKKRLNFLKFKPNSGYMYRCGKSGISFLSADPKASVVGATASMLLEVDEAQDVDKGVYDKKFSPMRASKNAPIVAYGTTWTDDTLLERFKRNIGEGRAPGKLFRVLPDEVALSNPAYGEFVDAEVREKGREHPYVKTQYFLEPLPSAGRMLNQQQLESIVGQHKRKDKRENEAQIVGGLDFAGADEVDEALVSLAGPSKRDSVALAIGAVEWIQIAVGLMVPHVRCLARYEWTNVNPVTLHTMLYRLLWDVWRCDRVHCDATGIGETGTALLAQAINKPNRERIIGHKFDSAWNTHTRLAFNLLSAINGGRFVDYAAEGFNPIEVAGQEAPIPLADPHRHVWWQRGHAKLEGKPEKKVRTYVPSGEGHDDLLRSDELMVDAAHEVGKPQMAKSGQVNFYG